MGPTTENGRSHTWGLLWLWEGVKDARQELKTEHQLESSMPWHQTQTAGAAASPGLTMMDTGEEKTS